MQLTLKCLHFLWRNTGNANEQSVNVNNRLNLNKAYIGFLYLELSWKFKLFLNKIFLKIQLVSIITKNALVYCQPSQKGPVQYLPITGADLEQSSTWLCYPTPHLHRGALPWLEE